MTAAEAREISNIEFDAPAEAAFGENDCYIGLDLADTRAMASLALVTRDPEGVVWGKTHNFICRESFDRRSSARREKVLKDFLAAGELTIAGEKHIDYTPIYEAITRWCAMYRVRGIVVDVMTGGKTLYDFVRRPFPAQVITFKKGKVTRSQGCCYFADMCTERRLRVAGSRLLRWELTNARKHEYPDGGTEIVRLEPDMKSGIDGLYALIHGMFPYSDQANKQGTIPTTMEDYEQSYKSLLMEAV